MATDHSIADQHLIAQQQKVRRLEELIQRANRARWQQLETGVPAFGRIADRAMDQLRDEANSEAQR